MNDKTEDILYIFGKFLLGLLIFLNAGILLLGVALVGFEGYNGIGYYFETFAILGIPLIIPLAAFFLVRKYPIVVGAIFLGMGMIFIIFFRIIAQPLGMETLKLSIPDFLLLVCGALFLASGLIRRRNKGNTVTQVGV